MSPPTAGSAGHVDPAGSAGHVDPAGSAGQGPSTPPSIRLLEPTDEGGLAQFFAALPTRDRTFFKEDVLDREVVSSWARDTRNRRLLALDEGGSVAAYGAILPGLGWSAHVGELRLVVSPSRRQQGLGRLMARRCLVEALDLRLSKVFVEVVADQIPALAMFEALGFVPEALLRGQVRDREGNLRDLILLAHSVDENWSAMVTAGIDDAIGEP